MVDLDELMRLHAATATPALEQLCWYDVQGEQDSFFTECLEAVPELVRELSLAREDVQAASGELLVEMPRPGTDMARVMLANAAMRRERDQLDEDYRKLFAVKAELRAEVERLKAIAKGNGDDSLHFARKADDIATQLRELREAVEGLASITEAAANDFESRNETHSSREVVVAIAAYGKMIAGQMREALAKGGAQPPERLNHAPNCPAHDGELCDCWKGGV